MNEVMIPTINLMASRARRAKAKRVFFSRLRMIAIVVLVVYVGITGVVMGVWWLTQSQVKAIDEKIDLERSLLSGLEKVEAEQRLLSIKLMMLSDFFNESDARQEVMDRLYQVFVEGAAMTSLAFETHEGIDLEVRANNIFVLARVLEDLEGMTAEERVREVEISDVSRSDEGTYRFRCLVKLRT